MAFFRQSLFWFFCVLSRKNPKNSPTKTRWTLENQKKAKKAGFFDDFWGFSPETLRRLEKAGHLDSFFRFHRGKVGKSVVASIPPGKGDQLLH